MLVNDNACFMIHFNQCSIGSVVPRELMCIKHNKVIVIIIINELHINNRLLSVLAKYTKPQTTRVPVSSTVPHLTRPKYSFFL